MQGQRLSSQKSRVDFGVDAADYFGREIREFDNASGFGLAQRDAPVYRHAYVYQAIFTIGSGENKRYGGIQLRARIHNHNPEIRGPLKEWLERSAHRAAHVYDSGIEHATYGAGGGYLTGFAPHEEHQNWGSNQVGDDEIATALGVIDWSVEVYTDDNFNSADLSGIAQGTANPYHATVRTTTGTPSVDIPPTKWVIGWEDSRRGGDGEYYTRPQPDTAASDRYRDGAGSGKKVFVNNKPIGTIEGKGRVWLSPEYGRGDPNKTVSRFGTYWSREGLVDETGATYQAIRKGGVLYQVGEDEGAVYLVTRRERPAGWSESDPDSVPVDMEAHRGAPSTEVLLLALDDPDEPVETHAVRDEELVKHMGYSNPEYTHLVAGEWRPNVASHRHPEDDR